MNETLRTGEKTVSWYRGPFVPYQVAPQNFTLPFASSDSALNYDPTTGMLDVSYAAAWELGRLISLQDKSFSIDLYNWKKGLTLDVVNGIEKDLINQISKNLLDVNSIEYTEPNEQNSHALMKALTNILVSK